MTWREQMFTVKPVATLLAEMNSDNGLRRVLGPVALTSLGVGCIIGAGIFVLTGLAANQYAGPGLVLSFIIAGFGCTLAGLCYAEFASMVPVAGSAYTYTYATLGELMAWIIGWDLLLEYAVASSTVAHGWSHYFVSFLGIFDIVLPQAWIANPFDFDPTTQTWVATGAYLNLPAAIVVLLITCVLVIGIKESARFNSAMVILKLAVVLFVIVVGAGYIETENWQPFLPYGMSGVLKGSAYIFFAYIGFDSVSTHAEEARNPQRDVPIGIIASLTLCTILYILVAGVLTGMVPYYEIDIDAPVADAFRQRGLHAAELLISVGAVVGITSVLLVLMLSAARILLALARDGLISRDFFGAVHPKYRTPHKATILVGVFVAIVGATFPLKLLADLVNIGTLMAFVVVCAAVIIMRRTNPDLPRPFRTPFMPWVPIGGMIMNLGMMFSLGWENWLRLVVWLLIGLVVYMMYGRHHSRLRTGV
ncbi:MAG TPA: amino acid permease [Candidatus Binatia bacterium]|jgi:APA family basic amino acid/polyamine antiporter|nr:amino acid permease [Candidatus Binatia bacterium]